ncbi:MAG TPA: aspartate dehydrogenase [Nitrososphaeraceae archaeon]|jgi:aspartate dehydrogenase|nr:aspartate dehydrogenase [Nitrososphaeraceae archaeon]
MQRRIGIIGCGTIGTELALSIDKSHVKNAVIVFLFDSITNASLDLRDKLFKNYPSVFSKFSQLISSSPFKEADIIVEAASQAAVKTFAKKIVSSNKSLMIMSTGALSDAHLLKELYNTVVKHDSHIYFPTGAIAGIDALCSVKQHLDFVMLTTTKNPKSLAGAPFFDLTNIKPETIRKRKLLYNGNASNAIKMFPTNINVAVLLSLAGVGTEKTRVRVIADPNIDRNEHEIIARGKFGEILIVVRNVPSPHNPKTSYLASLSAIECLRRICDDKIRIGT